MSSGIGTVVPYVLGDVFSLSSSKDGNVELGLVPLSSSEPAESWSLSNLTLLPSPVLPLAWLGNSGLEYTSLALVVVLSPLLSTSSREDIAPPREATRRLVGLVPVLILSLICIPGERSSSPGVTTF